MDRRKFAGSFIMAASMPAITTALAGEKPAAANQEPDWWGSVEETLVFQAESEVGNLKLEVELILPEEERISSLQNDSGEHVGYALDGRQLPEGFWPGRSVLTRFEFWWGDKKIVIPDALWKRLPGFRIMTTPLKLDQVEPEFFGKAVEFFAQLEQPRISLSGDHDTALIEWARPEECDGRSVFRWIISRDGSVLRHWEPPAGDS